MLRIWMLAVVVVVVATGRVDAKPVNSPKDLQVGLQKFLDSITDDPKTAAIAGTQLILLPDAAGVVNAPAGLAVKDVLGQPGAVTWKVKVVRATVSLSYGTTGSIGADVDALDAKTKKKLASLRVSAQLMREDAKKPFTVLAVQFGVPLTDDAAGARAEAGKEAKLAALPAGLVSAAAAQKVEGYKDGEYSIEEVGALDKTKLSNMLSNGGLMLGSGPGENVTWSYNKPDAIKNWKLELAPDGKVAFGGSPGDNGAFWVAANIKAKRTYKGKPIEHAYRALFLFEMIYSGEGGVPSTRLDVAQFSSPR